MRSSSAWPRPCATPPCTWPRTIIGFTVLPKSSHDAIADDLDHAGLGIHLHLGHVAAVREGVLGDRRHLGGVQRGRRLAGRRLLPLRGGERDDVDAAIGADDGEPAVARSAMSAGAASSTSAAACLPLSITVVGGQQDRLAFGIEAARAAGAAADRDGVRVALADADLLAVDAEPLRGELDIGRSRAPGRSIACRHSTSTKPSSAKRISARSVGSPIGDLEIVGEADAATPALPRGRRAPGGEAGVVHLASAPHPAPSAKSPLS